MSSPTVPATPKRGKMDPKQRRIALAVAGGALLALLVALRRRSNGGGGGTDTTAPPGIGSGSGGATADGLPGSSTFADNGAALGELNSTLTGITGAMNLLIDNQQAAYQAQQDAAAAQAAAAQQAAVAATTPAGAPLTAVPAPSGIPAAVAEGEAPPMELTIQNDVPAPAPAIATAPAQLSTIGSLSGLAGNSATAIGKFLMPPPPPPSPVAKAQVAAGGKTTGTVGVKGVATGTFKVPGVKAPTKPAAKPANSIVLKTGGHPATNKPTTVPKRKK